MQSLETTFEIINRKKRAIWVYEYNHECDVVVETVNVSWRHESITWSKAARDINKSGRLRYAKAQLTVQNSVTGFHSGKKTTEFEEMWRHSIFTKRTFWVRELSFYFQLKSINGERIPLIVSKLRKKNNSRNKMQMLVTSSGDVMI